MSDFFYKAISTTGEVKQGTINADDQQGVVAWLQSQRLSPLVIKPNHSWSIVPLLHYRQRVKMADIVAFTQQLATMLNAGLPMERALQLLLKMNRQPAMQHHLDSIIAKVRDGESLSNALESCKNLVPTLYISMIRAGETGGTLGTTLQSLSDYLNRAQDLQRSIVSALIYPAILLIMAVASVIALLVFVIPSFEPMFAELGSDMPTITQIVIGSGAFLQDYWWALIIIILLGLTGIRQQLANPTSRLRFHAWLLNNKTIGDLLVKMETARFARTLSALTANGVPILRSLSLSSDVLNNTAFTRDIKQLIQAVKTGQSLAEALNKIPYFPAMALQMLTVGEETGEISQMLAKIADNYDKEVKTTMDRLLSLLVPVMILLLSAIIATIVISILLAILSVNNLFG
ncbi:MAG: general secretion pathway protein F [Shewanella psychromarinicola]|jgi:general secretion pathway protein F|uniref:type II secretion system F family protein n=1 Tax=Shewanella psychromarinicola TaxID=2487742 RepID=UPI003EEBC162